MDDEYGGYGKNWHAGFVQGLRDAGLSGEVLSTDQSIVV